MERIGEDPVRMANTVNDADLPTGQFQAQNEAVGVLLPSINLRKRSRENTETGTGAIVARPSADECGKTGSQVIGTLPGCEAGIAGFATSRCPQSPLLHLWFLCYALSALAICVGGLISRCL